MIITALIKELEGKYTVLRVFRNKQTDVRYVPRMEGFFDAVLVQNVDGIGLIKNKRKVVCRMGGIRTFRGAIDRYDDQMKKVFGIIATNTELYNIGKRVNENVFLIPNGLDIEQFKPVKRKRNKDIFIVGFAGNISFKRAREYKGFDYIEGAVKVLKSQGYNVELKSAFYGEGQIPHNEIVERFYSKIDCYCLASINEGCNNTIMEALACGVPVLCTQVGYHGEMLTDGEDCLFIKRDIKDIAEKIKKLIEDTSLREKLAKKGREFAEKNHDIKKIAKQYDEIFGRCIEENEKLKEVDEKERKTTVRVRVLKSFYENGIWREGKEKLMSLKRAKELGSMVEILEVVDE
ncbi:glycosyltransferase family 4 protein [bacterium]|nr:glycosyltransferase family 4 protein [bacterium]